MHLRYQYRIYPLPGQQITLARTFGCARVVWNDALTARKTAWRDGLPYPTSGYLSKALITEAKKTPDRVWLVRAPTGVLQQSLRDLDRAFKNFFDSLKGKRKGLKLGPPRLKKRTSRQAVRYTRSDRFKILDSGKLRLPKIGAVKVAWSRELPADPSSVTVIKTSDGKYYASFVVEAGEPEPLPEVEDDTGIDLGLSSFAVLKGPGHQVAEVFPAGRTQDQESPAGGLRQTERLEQPA